MLLLTSEFVIVSRAGDDARDVTAAAETVPDDDTAEGVSAEHYDNPTA
jgi:hypothetical protein